MSISTLSFTSASRTSVLKLQTELRDATQEQSTNRHVDVGKTLGRLTGSAVSSRVQETSLTKILESNKLISNRLELIDDSMATITTGAETMLSSLLNGTKDATSIKVALSHASSGLQQVAGALNLNVGGQYVFGGDQTDRAPIAAYETSPSVSPAQTATRQSFDAFVSAALTATGATDRKAVTAEQMKAYLTTGFTDTATPPVTHRFDDLFTDAAWNANWSDASNGEIRSGISKSEQVVSSASANETAFRNITSAYALIQDAGLGDLGEGALQAVKDNAYARMKTGIDQVTRLRADVGVKLARIDSADETLTQQKDILTSTLSNLEEVDLTEAAQRVLRLETQLEAAYTVTGRLQKLNILDYL